MLDSLRLSDRATSMMVSAALVCVVAGMAYWLLRGPIAERTRLQQAYLDSESATAERVPSSELSRQRQVQESELESLRQRLYFQSEGRNSSEIVPYIIRILDSISRKHAVNLHGVVPLDVRPVLTLEELPFDIIIVGTYPRVYAWLEDAEQALSPMAVKNFSIKPALRQVGVTMRMRVVSYRLPAEEGA